MLAFSEPNRPKMILFEKGVAMLVVKSIFYHVTYESIQLSIYILGTRYAACRSALTSRRHRRLRATIKASCRLRTLGVRQSSLQHQARSSADLSKGAQLHNLLSKPPFVRRDVRI